MVGSKEIVSGAFFRIKVRVETEVDDLSFSEVQTKHNRDRPFLLDELCDRGQIPNSADTLKDLGPQVDRLLLERRNVVWDGEMVSDFGCQSAKQTDTVKGPREKHLDKLEELSLFFRIAGDHTGQVISKQDVVSLVCHFCVLDFREGVTEVLVDSDHEKLVWKLCCVFGLDMDTPDREDRRRR